MPKKDWPVWVGEVFFQFVEQGLNEGFLVNSGRNTWKERKQEGKELSVKKNTKGEMVYVRWIYECNSAHHIHFLPISVGCFFAVIETERALRHK